MIHKFENNCLTSAFIKLFITSNDIHSNSQQYTFTCYCKCPGSQILFCLKQILVLLVTM